MADEANLSELGAHVRHADPDRFFASLFAPAAKREALFALLAFNHEIARLREAITDPMIGEMRLAWWREVLDAVAAGAPARAHPVAQGLRAAYAAHRFSLDPLYALIDARSFDLYGDPMPDMAALESYAKATGGGLHRTMAEALGANAAALDAAEALGTAWALTGIVRTLRIHSARGQLYLPRRELITRGTSVESVLGGQSSTGLKIVIGEIVDLAQSHAARARSAKPGSALPALLPGALLELHWQRLTRAGFDPFQDASEPSQLVRLSALVLASLRKKI